MKEYTLNCAEMTSRESLHEYLKDALSLPEYYGRNLDALKDCLEELIPCRIRLVGTLSLGDYGQAFIALLQELDRRHEGFEAEIVQ